jgi:transposase InsO family protein
MQIQRLGWKIRGFYRTADYALRWDMDDSEAQQRYRILRFWDKHGLAATMEAFEVSRRTLFNWKAKLHSEGGNIAALAVKSTAPKRRRQRNWPTAVTGEIRRLRQTHPNLGKEKLAVLLAAFCRQRALTCPSARTIGRIMADAPDRMRHAPQRLTGHGKARLPRPPKPRKPKGFKALFPGHCVALDTIERHRYGLRRYLITVTDTHSRFGFALASPSRNSRVASTVWALARTFFPGPMTIALTDNGGEFAKHFTTLLAQQQVPHWHTYPRTPKMNAHCERFNRTIQEEFVDFHDDLLFTDLQLFNDKLLDWLSWYNIERPHHSLALQSPMQVIGHFFNSQECTMWWPNTNACNSRALG